jgi:hypothetical protein
MSANCANSMVDPFDDHENTSELDPGLSPNGKFVDV